MAYQVQMNTIDESGNATPIYPKNRTKDVFVGAFNAAAEATLPGESSDETLASSLQLVKAYLTKLKSAAYVNIAETLTNDKTTVPSTNLLYDVNIVANNALPKSGGEMSGYITFPNTYGTNDVYNTGLIFKGISGSPSSLTEKEYTIKAVKWSTSGSSYLMGALGATTLVPLDEFADLGGTGKKWNNLYVDYINSFILAGNIELSTDATYSIGSSSARIGDIYVKTLQNVSKISFVHGSYEASSLTTTYEQYDRYGWRTALQIGCSLIPIGDGALKLGDSSHSFGSLYCKYVYGIDGIHFAPPEGTTYNPGIYATDSTTSGAIDLKLDNIKDISPDSSTYPLTLGCGGYGIQTINLTNELRTNSDTAVIGGSAYKPEQGMRSYPFANVFTARLSVTDGSDFSYNFPIAWSSSISITYQSHPLESASLRGAYMGSSSLHCMIYGYRIGLNAVSTMSINKSFIQYSDEKVKHFTDDIINDVEKIIEVFDKISVKSFKLKYSTTDKVSIGLNAQEFKRTLEDCDIDPFKYEVLNVTYSTYIRRGEDDEDDKFYLVFYSIAYDQLHTLSLLKIRDMEEKHTAKLAELESQNKSLEDRLKAIESKLG